VHTNKDMPANVCIHGGLLQERWGGYDE
jgi:hypothetical protein